MSLELQPFSLEIGRDGDTVVVAVMGDLDVATAPALRSALDEIIVHQGSLSVRVDLAQVTFMDSTGLNVLATAWKHLRAREGTISIANPRPTITRLLELSGLLSVFGGLQTAPNALYGLGRAKSVITG